MEGSGFVNSKEFSDVSEVENLEVNCSQEDTGFHGQICHSRFDEKVFLLYIETIAYQELVKFSEASKTIFSLI